MFYLGAHKLVWLKRTRVPLFINRRTFALAKSYPRALGRWALDSGAFSEITLHGRWSIGAHEYVAQVRRIARDTGNMDWAAIQDWMCEPHMLAKTGLSIAEHQRRTVQSYIDLRTIAPELPWTPVLQGWREADYHEHVNMYGRSGVDLSLLPVVGLGSVCRRQGTTEFVTIVRSLAARGLRMHGFGVKTQGLEQVADLLVSSDSMAWSRKARWLGRPGMPECVGSGHKNCANCMLFALHWREQLLARLPERWRDPPRGVSPALSPNLVSS